MSGVTGSGNVIAGDLRITGGSVIVDTASDEGLQDSTGNFAGAFASSGNSSVGFLNELELWAQNLLRAKVTSDGITFVGVGERGLNTIKQVIHASGSIDYTAGVPSLLPGSHNVSSIVDTGVGSITINYTSSNGGTTAPAVGNTKNTESSSVVRSGSASASSVVFSISDVSGVQRDYDFCFIVGSGI